MESDSVKTLTQNQIRYLKLYLDLFVPNDTMPNGVNLKYGASLPSAIAYNFIYTYMVEGILKNGVYKEYQQETLNTYVIPVVVHNWTWLDQNGYIK